MHINRKSDSDFKHVYAFLVQFFISVVSGLEKKKKVNFVCDALK